ncbi:MAG: hypothetical protein ACYC7D_11390 [Nitrososphaerales archaeon]
MLRSFSPSTSTAYLFLMLALLFGFPLLTVYYNVSSTFYFAVIFPYLLTTGIVTLLLLYLSNKKVSNSLLSLNGKGMAPSTSTFIAKFNSLPIYAIMVLASLTLVSFLAERILVGQAYPYPPSSNAGAIGAVYIVLLVITSVLGFARVLYLGFPILRGILQDRKYAIMVVILSAAFSIVYLTEVNQIVITGFSSGSYVPTPSNSYPFAYVFTVGVQQPFINLVYLPYVLIQLNPIVNLMIVPYEMVFAVILSLLVVSSIVMTHYLVSKNFGASCSTKGGTMSTVGSLIGMCATCPTCLVPAFITVIFGGIAAAGAAFSNIYGIVIPPIVSVALLLVSMFYISSIIKKRTNVNSYA